MKVKGKQFEWGTWLLWILTSTVGIIVGMYLNFFLLAFTILVLGLDSCDACDILASGFGFGIGVGFLQWLVLWRRVPGVRVRWWVLASAVSGFGIFQAGFTGYSDRLLNYRSLLVWTGVVALSGAVTGILQWLVLRGQVSRAGWWVLASTLGWGLGMSAAVALSRGVGASDTVSLVGMGIVLGAVTGGALVWLLRQPKPEG